MSTNTNNITTDVSENTNNATTNTDISKTKELQLKNVNGVKNAMFFQK